MYKLKSNAILHTPLHPDCLVSLIKRVRKALEMAIELLMQQIYSTTQLKHKNNTHTCTANTV